MEKKDLDSLANDLLRMAVRQNNSVIKCRAHFYLSHYEPDLPDSIRNIRKQHLKLAISMAENLANDTLLSQVYNQNGVWELEDLGNISTAQYWFNRSLEHAKLTGRRAYEIPAEANLSETYRLDNDTLGLRYSHDLLDYATNHNDPLLKLSAGLTLAMYYSTVASDSAELRPYIEAMQPQDSLIPGCVDLIYARYFYNHCNYTEAERYILRTDMQKYPDMPLLYARILRATGRYAESDLALASASGFGPAISLFDRGEILRLGAENAHDLGDDTRAFYLQKRLDSYKDSISGIRNADVTRRYRIEYEVMKKDREISVQKARLRNIMIWAASSATLVIVITTGLILWFRHRNKMYRDIVRQNREAIEHQHLLTEKIVNRDHKIEELRKYISSMTKNVTSGPDVTTEVRDVAIDDNKTKSPRVSDEKANDIFERIMYLLDHDEIWRDPQITRDRFAELAGCNRTYFTEIIKGRTGMNFPQFINSYRIREAIRILSDPTDETSLSSISTSVGFMTLQTFYSSFKQTTGISPSRYRRTAKIL